MSRIRIPTDQLHRAIVEIKARAAGPLLDGLRKRMHRIAEPMIVHLPREMRGEVIGADGREQHHETNRIQQRKIHAPL